MKTSLNRLECLDGLRGWAALTVVLGHLTMNVKPFNYLLLTPLTDTKLAVAVFFIISGFVLSYRFIGQQVSVETFCKAFIARYLRLSIPIAVVSLLVLFIGFYCSGFHHKGAIVLLEPRWGYDSFYSFEPSFLDALKFSFCDVFFHYNPDHTYIPPAWTMPRELLGSYFIYVVVFFAGFHQYWHRRTLFAGIIATVALAVLCVKFHYSAFFLYGYLLAEFYKNGILITQKKPEWRIALPIFIALIIYSSFRTPERSLFLPMVAMSFAVVWSVLYSSRLTAFFSNRVSLFLGKISFPLYLIHVPIYCTFSSWLIVKLYGLGFSELQMYSVVYVLSIIVAIFCANLLYPVEQFAIQVSRRVNNISLTFLPGRQLSNI